MTEDQLSEIEKHLGRQLTPEEKRLLRYTEKESPPRPVTEAPPHPESESPPRPAKSPKAPKRKKAAQSG